MEQAKQRYRIFYYVMDLKTDLPKIDRYFGTPETVTISYRYNDYRRASRRAAKLDDEYGNSRHHVEKVKAWANAWTNNTTQNQMNNLAKARQQLITAYFLCEELEPQKEIDEELQAEIMYALDRALDVMDTAAWPNP